MKRLLHFITILIGLTLGTLMVSATRTSYSVHQGNDRLQQAVYPAFAAPERPQRILIISPHPDDETLGCGGLIQRARNRGVPVTVAIVTNGDAFPWAVQRAYRKIRPRPEDYVRFGKLRQREALAALAKLGVPKKDVIFLGYPDRGLEAMWMSHWSGAQPYRSLHTHRTHNPYQKSLRPEASYSGESLVEDLRRIIGDVQPTDLFFTHPNDDHPDHAYMSGFVVAALHRLGHDHPVSDAASFGLAKLGQANSVIRLHTFLIHRGNWPTPQGYHADQKLPPPAALARLDTRWRTFPLTTDETASKARAIRTYKSQMQVRPGSRFLLSFARQNEIFGEYRFLHTSRHLALGPHQSTPWYLTYDPTDDKVPRDLQPGADLQEIGIRREKDRLVVRVTTQGKVSRWVKYRINLHRMGVNSPRERVARRFIAPRNGKLTGTGITCAWESHALEAHIPLEWLHSPTEVMVSAETIVGNIVVDRSAMRGFTMNPAAVNGSYVSVGSTSRMN